MNVLLIDDHFCAREGVANLLRQMFPDILVHEAESFAAGLIIVRTTPLNLVLLDVQLPGMQGLEGLKVLRDEFSCLCVVMYSGLDDRELVFESLRLGAMGFITKNLSRLAFIEALRDVLSGRVFLPASVVGPQVLSRQVDLGEELTVTDPGRLGLTEREFEVLAWLVQGKCNKEIARQLQIKEQTVKNHLRPIFQKFGVVRRAELLVRLYELGVVFGRPDIGNYR